MVGFEFKTDDRWSKLEKESQCPECGSEEYYRYRTAIARLPNSNICDDCGYERREMATG